MHTERAVPKRVPGAQQRHPRAQRVETKEQDRTCPRMCPCQCASPCPCPYPCPCLCVGGCAWGGCTLADAPQASQQTCGKLFLELWSEDMERGCAAAAPTVQVSSGAMLLVSRSVGLIRLNSFRRNFSHPPFRQVPRGMRPTPREIGGGQPRPRSSDGAWTVAQPAASLEETWFGQRELAQAGRAASRRQSS